MAKRRKKKKKWFSISFDACEICKKKFFSRKFVISFVLTLFVTILLLTRFIEFSDWGDFIKWIFGVYVVGNSAEHFAEALKEKKTGTESTVPQATSTGKLVG